MMDLRPSALLERVRTPEGMKWVRYSAVSVIAVAVNLLFLAFTFGVLRWSARTSNIVAVSVSAVPSYYLNRYWVWGKSGKSHLLKEVAPFWAMAFIGLVFSTWAAGYANSHADEITSSHLLKTGIVMFANLAAFGVLWVGKFIIMNKVLFAHHPEDLPEALDGRTGIPT
jgi:putative flippase GtrA